MSSPCRRHFQFSLFSWKKKWFLALFFLAASLSPCLQRNQSTEHLPFPSILKKYATSTLFFLAEIHSPSKRRILDTRSHTSLFMKAEMKKSLLGEQLIIQKLINTYMIWKNMFSLMICGTERSSKCCQTQLIKTVQASRKTLWSILMFRVANETDSLL